MRAGAAAGRADAMRRSTLGLSPRPRLSFGLALVLAVALLTGCASAPKAPTCNASAYRSLNPVHYQPVTDRSRADVPFLAPDV
jgi:hypothetical protein